MSPASKNTTKPKSRSSSESRSAGWISGQKANHREAVRFLRLAVGKIVIAQSQTDRLGTPYKFGNGEAGREKIQIARRDALYRSDELEKQTGN